MPCPRTCLERHLWCAWCVLPPLWSKEAIESRHKRLKRKRAKEAAARIAEDEERKRRETVTETREKRYLKKRTREGGSKGEALATALDAADD